MATKKSGGSTRNGRDSRGKRLGVKVFGGTYVTKGSIILRQRGTKILPHNDVGIGTDHTIYSLKDGYVLFHKNKHTNRTLVSVV